MLQTQLQTMLLSALDVTCHQEYRYGYHFPLNIQFMILYSVVLFLHDLSNVKVFKVFRMEKKGEYVHLGHWMCILLHYIKYRLD